VVGGVVFSAGSALAALNAKTGAVIWSASLGGALLFDSPAVANGTVYIGGTLGNTPKQTGVLYAVNARTGKLVWSAPLDNSEIDSSPSVANAVVYIGTDGGTLYAFNARTGARLAAVAGVSGQSSPTVANGMVYSEDQNGVLFALGLGTEATGRHGSP